MLNNFWIFKKLIKVEIKIKQEISKKILNKKNRKIENIKNLIFKITRNKKN